MEKDRLFSNRDKASREMYKQTRKAIGGPTRIDSLFVATTLTGEPVNYREDFTQPLLESEYRKAGLIMHTVEHARSNPLTLVPELVKTKAFAIDAVIINGEMHKDNGTHMVAVVPTDTEEDGTKLTEYHVIDSLTEGGVTSYKSEIEAYEHIQSLFVPESVLISLHPSEKEVERRTHHGDEIITEMLQVGDNAFIEVQVANDDPRFFGKKESEVTTAETLEQDKKALQEVMHALIDDFHSEDPSRKQYLYTEFATIAARHDMRYPLLSEIAMDHLEPGATPSSEDLQNVHKTIETQPTDNSIVDTQIPASVLRSAKRLVAHYAQEQASDPSLRVVDIDAQVSFIDEQVALYNKSLYDLGDLSEYNPREFTGDELLKGTRAAYEEARRKGLDVMTPDSENVRSDGKVAVTYGFTTFEKTGKWRKKQQTSWRSAMVLVLDTEQRKPIIYGAQDGSSHEIMIDGVGTSVENLTVDRAVAVHTNNLNIKEVEVEGGASLHFDSGHLAYATVRPEATVTFENSVVNMVSSDKNTRTYAHYSQIGRVQVINGLFDVGGTDIGHLYASDARVSVYGDIVKLTADNKNTAFTQQQGVCGEYYGLNQAHIVHFASYPEKVTASPNTRYFVDDETVQIDRDGNRCVYSKAYDQFQYDREHTIDAMHTLVDWSGQNDDVEGPRRSL